MAARDERSGADQAPAAYLDLRGERTPVPPAGTLTVGREGDVTVDDPYLHRRFLELSHDAGLLWLANVGSATTATVSDADGLAQSWLAPGDRLPVVFERTVVWFTAGPTTYELGIVQPDAPFVTTARPVPGEGRAVLGRVTFTPEQRLLLLALAEDVLRGGHRGAGDIPDSAAAAARLGWTRTKLNRKLDNVCARLAGLGVRGLAADGDRAASARRARLVEYALAARLVTVADLPDLDAVDAEHR